MQALLDLGLTQEQISGHDCSDEEILNITLTYLQQRPEGVSITDAMQEICGLEANEIHMRHLGFSLEEAQSHPNHLSEIVVVLYRALELGLPKEALKGHGWGSPELSEATLTYLKERPEGVSITDAMDNVRGLSAYDVYEAQLHHLGLEPYEIARLGLHVPTEHPSVMNRNRLHQVVLFIQAKRDAGEDIHQAIQSVEKLSAATIMAIRHGWLTKVDDEQGYRDLFCHHESTKVLEDALALGLRQDQMCDHSWHDVDTADATLKFLQRRSDDQSAIDGMDQILGVDRFLIDRYEVWSPLGLTAKMLSNHYFHEEAFDEMMGYLKRRMQQGKSPELAMEEIQGIPSEYEEFEKIMSMPIPVDERAEHAWCDEDVTALTRYYLQERPSWQSFEQAWREIKGKDAREITDRVLLRLGWSLRRAREKKFWDVKEFFSSIPLIRDFEALGLTYDDLRGVPLSSCMLSYVQGRVEDGQNASYTIFSFCIPQEEREGHDWRDEDILKATLVYLQERPEGQEILDAWHEIKGLRSYDAIYKKALSRSHAIIEKQDGDQSENLNEFDDLVWDQDCYMNIESLKLIVDQFKTKKEPSTEERVIEILYDLCKSEFIVSIDILIKITELGLDISQFSWHNWSRDIAKLTLSHLESRPKEQTISEAMLEIHGWPSSAIESLPEFKALGLTSEDLQEHLEHSEEDKSALTLEYLRERISQGVSAKEALDEIEGLNVFQFNLLKTGLKKSDIVEFYSHSMEELPHLEERPIGQSIQDAWHIAETCKTANDLRGLRWGLPLGEINHSAVFNLLSMTPKEQWPEVVTETKGIKSRYEVLALMLGLKVSDLKDHQLGRPHLGEASLHFLRTSSLPLQEAMEAIRGLDAVDKFAAIALGLKKTELYGHSWDQTPKTIEYLKKRIQEGQSPALAMDEIRGLGTKAIKLMLLGVPRDAFPEHIEKRHLDHIIDYVRKQHDRQSALAAFNKVWGLSKEEVKLLELGLSRESQGLPSISGPKVRLDHHRFHFVNGFDLEEALILGVDPSQLRGHNWINDDVSRETLQYLRSRPLGCSVDEAMADIHGLNEAQIKAMGLGLLRNELDGHHWWLDFGQTTVEYLEGRPTPQTPAAAMDEIRGVEYIWAIRAMRLGLPREELKGHVWGKAPAPAPNRRASSEKWGMGEVIGRATFKFLKQHRQDIVSAMKKIRGLRDVAAIEAIALGLTREEIKGHHWGGDVGHETVVYLEGRPISQTLDAAMDEIRGVEYVWAIRAMRLGLPREELKGQCWGAAPTAAPNRRASGEERGMKEEIGRATFKFLKQHRQDIVSAMEKIRGLKDVAAIEAIALGLTKEEIKGHRWGQHYSPDVTLRYLRERPPGVLVSDAMKQVMGMVGDEILYLQQRMKYASSITGFPLYVFYLKKFEVAQFSLIKKGTPWHQACPKASMRYMHTSGMLSSLVGMFCALKREKGSRSHSSRLPEVIARRIAAFLTVEDLRNAYAVNASMSKTADLVNEILPHSEQFSGKAAKALPEKGQKTLDERGGAWCEAQRFYLS